MRKHLPVLILSAAVALPALTYAQEQQQERQQQQRQEQQQGQTSERQGRTGVQTDEQQAGGEQVERDVTRGRVKEYTPGQAITIDVPMAIDKSYNLAQQDEKQRVTVAEGLKVGEPVAVIEWEQNNVKFVRIVPQGAEAAMADGAFAPSATATGKVTQMTPGQKISVTLEGGGSRTFDLQSQTGPQVIVARGVSSGDTVRILEGREGDRTVVRIEKVEGTEGQRANGTRTQDEKTRQTQTDQDK